MTDNMKLWNQVFHTDPKHTKSVSFGRKFTSIDPMYQIRLATEVLGPVGLGWTYAAEHSIKEVTEGIILAICDVTIEYSFDDQQGSFGPIRGCEMLYGNSSPSKPPRLDDDAPKKALTDALTKALSHMGFNADVFLGLFDDQKYVARMRKEMDAKEATNTAVTKAKEDGDWADRLIEQATAAQNTTILDEIKAEVKGQSRSRSKGAVQSVVAEVLRAEKKLSGEKTNV